MSMNNIINLEDDLVTVETEALEEERINADKNYASLKASIRSIASHIPFPNTEIYDVGIDYEDISRLQYEKNRNAPYWNKIDNLKKYYNNGSLYAGHVLFNNKDYYLMDSPYLNTMPMHDVNAVLVNTDDKEYHTILSAWRYPQNSPVTFSRNITMKNRFVEYVDIVLDISNNLFNNITDSYLKKALVRNKDKKEIQSIIQTIQEKQESIRLTGKDISFIVQGCAGSGKTMVLLHRLRYLIFNKEISNDEYVFLVPSAGFKSYIEDISEKFNIRYSNISTYSEYYQKIIGRRYSEIKNDLSELVFSSDYLSRVYSEKFMQECYYALFDFLHNKVNELIDYCDMLLNVIIEKEEQQINANITALKTEAVTTINVIAKKIKEHIDVNISQNYENLSVFYEIRSNIYKENKDIYDQLTNEDIEIIISPNDPRITSNVELNKLLEEIDVEKKSMEKASFFTVRAHKNKLNALTKQYDDAYEKQVSELIQADKLALKEKATNLNYVFNAITLEEMSEILSQYKDTFDLFNNEIITEEEKITDLNHYLEKKLSTEISRINHLIDLSSDLGNARQYYVESLTPSKEYFEEFIKTAQILYNSFISYISDKDAKSKFEDSFRLFSPRSDQQQLSYINSTLFNICKKKIKTEYEIKIADSYKHFWYLYLYCFYLTRDIMNLGVKYVFIDEGQDLSQAELALIYKINKQYYGNTVYYPVMNIFGDVNQTITLHGTTDWANINFIDKIFLLDENFRNTNQIIDYCNKYLPFSMKKIGIDMDHVSTFKNIRQIEKLIKDSSTELTFIVKDEYAMEDLQFALRDSQADYQIYTVKMSKGLEFKEVFVVNRDMSDNEKYISYTRALSKLNVIEDLPYVVSEDKQFIIQGDEEYNHLDV